MQKLKCGKCGGIGWSAAAARLNVDYAERVRSLDQLDDEDKAVLLWAGRLDPVGMDFDMPSGLFCSLHWPLVCARLKKSGLSPYCSHCKGSGSILINQDKQEDKKKYRFRAIK
ncbi:hypothetical protein [Gloeobacter kilaueensis]|uniref:Uncharacterized protein n=1 Tax=Gloeobacter kilaueensis (strain ATCC BAA-2537 / CCAP 1431/1 / ULC 316 / JS1) TaxID=1183438 RepID=U5QI36_GLOK1|nr:hypothetical protein [Gloeobacter kilaueensis]AGY57289.1 hypothetical protein GKIL_1043 [Gloeobacter kilaueensis JS1]